MFDHGPILASREFQIRRLRPTDAVALQRVIADPRVHGPTSYPVLPLEAVQQMIARWLQGEQEGTAARWAIARCADDELAGTCGFHRIDPVHRDAELGYELAPECWGRGLASSSVSAVLRWAFEATSQRRVHAHVWVGNQPSIRVLERCGFVREGCLRQFRLCRGEPRDFFLYGLLKPDVPA